MTKTYRFGVGLVLQGVSYPQLRDAAQAIDASSFEIIAFRDQFVSSGDIDQANYEVFTLLAGLAEATNRVRFVPSVVSTQKHDPRYIANAAATIDHISNGRLELGLGTGNLADEHRRYGLPFGTPGERVARLEEAIQVLTLLWTEPRATYNGRYFQLDDAPCEPKPTQKPLPLVLSAGGPKTLKLTARYAAGWRAFATANNLPLIRERNDQLDRYCRNIGRDPDTLDRTQAITPPADWWTSTPEMGLAVLNDYATAGITTMMMIAQPPFQIPAIERFSREIIPAFLASRS